LSIRVFCPGDRLSTAAMEVHLGIGKGRKGIEKLR